jgi:uncharacterized protein (DUF2236 family)
LDGTLRSYLRLIYGTPAVARHEVRRLHALHGPISGPDYDARDPSLALWVHATLVDSTIVANDRWLGRLPRARAARFYAEMVPLARAFGIPARLIPGDLDAFDDYVAWTLSPAGPAQVGAVARELAAAILHPPLPGQLARLALPSRLYDWAMWPAIELLPPAVRAGYGLAWGRREALVSRWLVAGWRAWRPLLPDSFRIMAQARTADRRRAAAEQGRSSG